MPTAAPKIEAAERPQHSWLTQHYDGRVMLSIWNGTGYSVRLEIDGAQAQQLGRALIDSAASLPRVGTAADLGCEVL